MFHLISRIDFCKYVLTVKLMQEHLSTPLFPLQVECGGHSGLFDELLHRANLLLQHHPRQPLPRRPPLQGHVPAHRRYRGPAPAVHPQQAPAQRSVPALMWTIWEVRGKI